MIRTEFEQMDRCKEIYVENGVPMCFVQDNFTIQKAQKHLMCCGKRMYACGGELGKLPDGTFGCLESFYRCEICGQETHDILIPL